MISLFRNLSTKKMTRKEFIYFIGLIALTVFGIPSLLKSLTDLGTPQKRKKFASTKHGFGTGAYGA